MWFLGKEVERWTLVLLMKIKSVSNSDAHVCTKFISLCTSFMNFPAITIKALYTKKASDQIAQSVKYDMNNSALFEHL